MKRAVILLLFLAGCASQADSCNRGTAAQVWFGEPHWFWTNWVDSECDGRCWEARWACAAEKPAGS